MSMKDNDGFTLVTYKHPRHYTRTARNHASSNDHTLPDNVKSAPRLLSVMIKYIEECKVELQTSSFYKELIKLMVDNLHTIQIPKVENFFEDFMCYGIGRLSQCPIARYQFALYLLLWQHFKPSGQCFIYDPVFTSLDKQMINHFGLVLTENDEAKRQVGSRTLFFVPHCGKPLYNNILWANWGTSLSNVVILGNSFHGYKEKIPLRQLMDEALYVFQVFPVTEEVRFPTTFYHNDVFNDMSIHFFKPDKLNKQDVTFWENTEEPVYNDNVEIILKSSM